jgi:hypothetical protein
MKTFAQELAEEEHRMAMRFHYHTRPREPMSFDEALKFARSAPVPHEWTDPKDSR